MRLKKKNKQKVSNSDSESEFVSSNDVKMEQAEIFDGNDSVDSLHEDSEELEGRNDSKQSTEKRKASIILFPKGLLQAKILKTLEMYPGDFWFLF